MSSILNIFIDDATERRLQAASDRLHRTIEDLAECAISEAVLEFAKKLKRDPAES